MIKNPLACVIVLITSVILGLASHQVSAEETALITKEKEKDAVQDFVKGPYKDYNLIIISINNIGAAHMSLYGYKRDTTPNLDKWAGDAIVFQNAFSPASWTLPVATSLFTSLYPYTHKVIHRYNENLLDKNIKTLPEILKENNYRTAAFTGGLDYIKEFGHMRGFEDTEDNPNFTGFEISLNQAKDWLSKNSDKKFFLFLHGYDAHAPFTPPDEFKGIFSHPEGKNITVDNRICLRGYKNSDNKFEAYYLTQHDPFAGTQPTKVQKKVIFPFEEKKADFTKERAQDFLKGLYKVTLTQDDIDYLRDLYDEEILYVDSLVGNFLNSLDKKTLNNTIIIILSEHGEMFAKHGRFGRAGTTRGTLYDDVVHIPLIIKIPGVGAKKVEGLVQIIDIMPTALALLGISPPQRIQGKNLIPLINKNIPVNEYVYAGTKFNVGKPRPHPFYKIRSINESIRNDKWKLIHEIKFAGPNINEGAEAEETFELYNLQKDPDELNDIVNKYPDITKSLKEKLSRWVKWSQEFVPVRPFTLEIPEDMRDDARKHGYW